MFQLLFIEDDAPASKRFLETIQQLPLDLNIFKVPGPRRAWFFIDARIHIDAIIAPSTLTDVDLLELICFERDHNPHAQLVLFGPAADDQRAQRLSAAAFFSFDEQPGQLLDKLSYVLNQKNPPPEKPDLTIPPASKRWDPAISVVLHIQCFPTEEQLPQIKDILDQFTWQNHREIRYRGRRYSLQLHKEDGVPSQEEQITIATQIQSELAGIGLSPCFMLFSQPILNREQCYNAYALMDYTMDYLITCDMRIAFMTQELVSQLVMAASIEIPGSELLHAIRTRQKAEALRITYQMQQKLHEAPIIPLPRLRGLISDCLFSIFQLTNQQYASEFFADLAAVSRLDQWQSMFPYLQKWLDLLSLTPQADALTPTKTFTVSQILNVIANTPLTDLSVESIAKTLYRSPTYLNDVFKDEMQISLVKYINRPRLTQAAELVRNSNRKIIDIAKEVGYDNYSYFCQVFRKHFSVSPAKYRTLSMDIKNSSSHDEAEMYDLDA